MLQPNVSVHDINLLARQMKKCYAYITLEQGWRCYRKRMVASMQEVKSQMQGSGFRIIRAEVHGAEHYQVVLHMKCIEASTCTCRDGQACKHKAAMFFQLCETAGKKPELYLSDFYQAHIEQRRHHMAARRREAQKAERERRMRASQVVLSPKDCANHWHLFFHKKYAMPFTDFQSSIIDIASWVKEQLYRESETMTEPVRTLLRMHALLFLLQQLSARYIGSAGGCFSRGGIAADEAIFPYMKQFEELAASFHGPMLEPAYRGHLYDLRTMAEELAFSEQESPVDWLAVCALIWSNLLNEEELKKGRMQLLGKLEQLKPLQAQPSRLHDAIRVGLVHVEALLGNDEQAISYMWELNVYDEPDRYLGYAQERMKLAQYDKLLLWLRALAPMASRLRYREHMEPYWLLWKQAYEGLPSMHGELNELLFGMIPVVFPYLSSFLLEQGRYRDWADIQLVHHLLPEEVVSSEWSSVLHAAPEVLLPLYHQAIERYIEERNRNSYRTAVVLLQDLRGLYERRGWVKTWERYIHELYERYGRLKAFQEELKRGALIHDGTASLDR